MRVPSSGGVGAPGGLVLAAAIALMLTAASSSADFASAKPVAVLPFVLHDGRVFLSARVDGKGPGQFQFGA